MSEDELIFKYLDSNYKILKNEIVEAYDDLRINANLLIIDICEIFGVAYESVNTILVDWLKKYKLSQDKIIRLFSYFTVTLKSEKFNIGLVSDDITFPKEEIEYDYIYGISGSKFKTLSKSKLSDLEIKFKLITFNSNLISKLSEYMILEHRADLDVNVYIHSAKLVMNYTGCSINRIDTTFNEDTSGASYKIDISVNMAIK